MKGRETNTKVLALGWGTVILGPLADTRKSGSLLGDRPSPGVHSAVSLGVLSPMWLLRTFSAMVDSIGRVPANAGGDASSPETLLLTPHQTTILNTQATPLPKQTNKQTNNPDWPSFNSRFNSVSKDNWEPAFLFFAPIALSSFRLPSKV